MQQRGWVRGIRDRVHQRRLLSALAKRYVSSRYYGDELAPAAAGKLRKLERKGFILALRVYAYDVRTTAAAILELHRGGETDEALSEKFALAARALSGWALKVVGFSLPHDSLLELADPLNIGLGAELQRWLLNQENWLVEADAWFLEFSSRIERFELDAARASAFLPKLR